MNTESVDAYLRDGCGRCEHYQTSACKVHRWTEPLKALRALALESGLAEEMKWGAPCYTLGGKNVAMVGAFVHHCVISFFKGVALPDPHGLLEPPGPNSRQARIVRFTSLEEVETRRVAVAELLQRALELERSGVKVATEVPSDPVPEELQDRLDADTALAEAFAALTPGRQRSHILYISGAKQRKTRVARVERCVPKILAGRGYLDR